MGKDFTEANEQTQKLANIYRDLLAMINDDVNREGLQKTPYRAATALQFLTQGYDVKLDDITSGALFTSTSDEMVLLKNIDLFSTCEHHLLPMIGKCHVAYLPQGKIIGLSKIPRIIDMFARRLQVQENLTVQIAECIQKITGALGVGVVIEAEHLCMVARGVEKKNITVKTIATLGVFRNSEKLRHEFLTALK